MKEESKRLFFAINLPLDVKHCIAEKILPLVPNEGWGKVSEENLHVTMHFLGSMPEGKIARLKEQAMELRDFGVFEAEVNCAGHFNGNVLWLGFGKGGKEFELLNSRLQQAIGTHDQKFHAHITLARNKGAEKRQAQAIVEKIGKEMKAMVFGAKSVELMESLLGSGKPKYAGLFSIPLAQGACRP